MSVARDILGPGSSDTADVARIADGDVTRSDGLSFSLSSGVVLSSDPVGLHAESIRVLRTHILAQHIRLGRRALALCAPTADVGCSSVAVNLAVGLAQAGIKTLLIDGDLRRPSLHEFIVPSHDVPGLAQGLSDESLTIDEILQANVLPNLSLIYAGGPAMQPQELLASGFKRIVDLCLRNFDITLVDTSPAHSSADARQVASVLTYALMVVGRDRTFVSDVTTLAEELQSDSVTVIGAVLKEG